MSDLLQEIEGNVLAVMWQVDYLAQNVGLCDF